MLQSINFSCHKSDKTLFLVENQFLFGRNCIISREKYIFLKKLQGLNGLGSLRIYILIWSRSAVVICCRFCSRVVGGILAATVAAESFHQRVVFLGYQVEASGCAPVRAVVVRRRRRPPGLWPYCRDDARGRRGHWRGSASGPNLGSRAVSCFSSKTSRGHICYRVSWQSLLLCFSQVSRHKLDRF